MKLDARLENSQWKFRRHIIQETVVQCFRFEASIFFSCLPSTMQQYQDLKLNPFKIRHYTICFSLLSHHHMRWNWGDLLCLPPYCDQCFRIYVFKQSQCSSSSYATCIVFLDMPVAYQACIVDIKKNSNINWNRMLIYNIIQVSSLLYFRKGTSVGECDHLMEVHIMHI
jgi:hypothetical protein